MLTIPLILGTLAALLVVIALLEPLARRLQLPHTVLLAAVGVVMGATATYLLFSPLTNALNDVARLVVFFPIDSEIFLYGFLPLLLFHAALSLDVRRMIEDAGHIFVLAVIAVVVATVAIGVSVAWVSGEALLVCLLLGAIVATTDPVAVLAIFRDLGVPARLVRLVEGESLLNDAAAIALFTIFLAALTTGGSITATDALVAFAVVSVGGVLVGWIGGLVGNLLVRLTCRSTPALVTVSLAVPYLVFVVADVAFGVSGVIAVIVSGMVLSAYSSVRIPPDSWERLKDIWDQIGFWAASLLFVLAALMVPRLLEGLDLNDLAALVVLIAAAFVARAVVLFGIMPALSLLRIAEKVGRRENIVILWGGLRGAVTLALALSITEHNQVPADQRQFIAILATGFVLFTILVNGLTLRPFVRLLKLDELSPLDRGLRGGVLAVALDNVRETLSTAASSYDIAKDTAAAARAPFDERAKRAKEEATSTEDLSDRERLTLGLVAMADREQRLLLEHLKEQTVTTAVIADLLGDVQRMGEGARSDGRIGYRRAAKRIVGYNVTFRLGMWLYRRVGMKRVLNRALSARFERLLLSRIVLKALAPFPKRRIAPLLGTRIADIMEEILEIRRADIGKALDALHLQYPAYTQDLERRLLTRIAVHRETREYEALFEDQLIGTELLSDLAQETREIEKALERARRIDVGASKDALIRQFPLFAGLSDAKITQVARVLKARFAVPGERIIRRGDRGDAVLFISSGAVEVTAPNARIRLGKGDFIGEIAFFYGGRRSADVTAIGYCNLLVLEASDFRAVLGRNPEIRSAVEAVAAERLRQRQAFAARGRAEHTALSEGGVTIIPADPPTGQQGDGPKTAESLLPGLDPPDGNAAGDAAGPSDGVGAEQQGASKPPADAPGDEGVSAEVRARSGEHDALADGATTDPASHDDETGPPRRSAAVDAG